MSCNIQSAVFFVRWKANFLGCQEANKNQTHTVTLHQAAGLSAIEMQQGTERDTGRVTETGRQGERVPTWAAPPPLPFPPLHNEVGKDPLCIGLINSYSSSAWHPGNRSGFALGLIFRPVEDSQSIRALFSLHTTNFLDLPKKRTEREGEWEGDWGRNRWHRGRDGGKIRMRERGRERKGERGLGSLVLQWFMMFRESDCLN